MADLTERVAILEQTSSDVDEDFLKASRHFDAHEGALTDLKTRLDQLQPTYRHCTQCKRALRAASLKCGICGHQN